MKDIKNRRKRFYQPWIIRVLVVVLAALSLSGAGRYAPPGNGPMVSGQTVEDLIEKGKTLFALRQIAGSLCRASPKRSSWTPEMASRSANVPGQAFHRGLRRCACRLCRAILLDPMDYDAYKGRAQVQRALKHYAESLEDCDTAISIIRRTPMSLTSGAGSSRKQEITKGRFRISAKRLSWFLPATST